MTNTISTYEQSAIDFLNQTNTTFEATFETFDYYFQDDEQKRNIFKCTLKNDKHKYSFRFGSSLNDSLKNSSDVIYDTEIDFYFGLKYEGLKTQYLSYSDKINIAKAKDFYNKKQTRLLLNKQKATDIYNEFIKANTNKYIKTINIITLAEWVDKLESKVIQKISEIKAKNFGEGIQAETIKLPTAYDVLAGLTKYEVGSFDNFCDDFGYDIDSRKAYKTYKAVLKEWKNVELLFTAEQLEQLREIN